MAHADDEVLLDYENARQLMRQLRELAPANPERVARLDAQDHLAPGLGTDPAVPVRIYRRRDATGPLPVLVSMHGGGFVAGSHDDMRTSDEAFADHLGCAVAAVEYRLAPETRFPGPADDCYAALCWLVEHADALGLDANRVVVYGGSAGGALAAATALRARDQNGPALRAQVLMIPVIHDRLDTPSTQTMRVNPGFSGDAARGMWALYLGDVDRTQTSPYAAPGRATDLTGLPPAYIRVHERDPLRDEGIEYAMRLMQAGVSTELHCFPGMFHGAPSERAEVEARANAELVAVIGEYLFVDAGFRQPAAG